MVAETAPSELLQTTPAGPPPDDPQVAPQPPQAVEPPSTEPAPPPEEPADAETAFAQFLEGKGAASQAPAPAVQDGQEQTQDPSPEVLAEAHRIASERAAEEARQRRQAGIVQSFQARGPAVRSVLERARSGELQVDQPLIDWVLNQFNEHHNSSAEVTRAEERHISLLGAVLTLPEADRKAFWEASVNDRSPEDFYKRFQAQARKGYVPESRLPAEYARGAKEAKAWFEEKGFLPSAKAPPQSDNNGSSGASVRWRTKEDARNLHAQGKLTYSEIKRINADPNIPEGYGR